MRATHRVNRIRDTAWWLRRAQLVGAAILVLSVPLALLSGTANANTLTSGDGYTALSTIGTVTTGTPYSSGQQINVAVSANPTLSLTNLEANGYTGEPHMVAEECDDPGGSTAGLPTTPTNNCDSETILSTTAVNADGSFQFSNSNTTPNPYTVYWLPDNATFGESSTNVPTCGTAPNYCVLYLGPDQTNFAKPHLFSAPFSVTNNGDDGEKAPGTGLSWPRRPRPPRTPPWWRRRRHLWWPTARTSPKSP